MSNDDTLLRKLRTNRGQSNDDTFEVTWQVDDGYVGRRPHTFEIKADDLDDDADDDSLTHEFWDQLQDRFEQKISPVSEDEAAFLAWAKRKLAERKAANAEG